MSTRPPSTTTPADLGALSGLLWAIGGGLVAIAVALLDSAAMGILTFGLWCLVTAWRIGVRG